MRYVYLSIACAAIFAIGFLADGLPGVYWFLGKSTLSTAAVLSSVTFRTRVSIPVAVLETGFVCATFLACIGYMTGYCSWYYDNYITILKVVCAVELAILIAGAPYGRIFGSISRMAGTRINRSPGAGLSTFSRFEDMS